MITWMQRHRKYLVVTIWISTIAFIGAGFVGWGQYNYGDKAGAVAKVGDVPISMRELQQSYSALYNQYNQIFQGNFDEAQAKSFGLQKQALKQLIDQTLILNLANSYNLRVTDQELFDEIQSEKAFSLDGSFDKETYYKVLRQSSMSIPEYEADVRKSLLIQKTLALFTLPPLPLEEKSLETAMYIADKINYKVLTTDLISIDTSDAKLRPYWETRQQNYMTLPAYTLEVVAQPMLNETFDDAAISEHFAANKHNFTDSEGKILTPEAARTQVIAALNEKATRKQALRTYVAFKKEKLDSGLSVKTMTLTQPSGNIDTELFGEIAALTKAEPYLKPRKVGNEYLIFKLNTVTPAMPKSFEAAKAEVIRDYAAEEKAGKLQEYAKNSVGTFNGTTTGFLTRENIGALKDLTDAESAELLNALFEQQSKRGYITLKNGKVILYNILEQKLLSKSKTDQENSIMRLKSSLLDQGLIKMLESKYAVEIYLEGL